MTKGETWNIAPENHYPLLDLLRTAAALLVLLGHARSWIFASIGSIDGPGFLLKSFWLITVLQHEAVVLFFVISGFLVGGRLVTSMGQKSFDLTAYLIARFARIYVVFGPALIISGLIFLIGPLVFRDFGGDSVQPLFSERQLDFGGIRALLSHAAILQGFICEPWSQNPPLWSLGYEWVLYLIAPAMLGLVMSRGLRIVRLVALALIMSGTVALAADPGRWAFWFAAWFLGVAASRVVRWTCLPMSVGILGAVALAAGMAVSGLHVVNLIVTDIVIALAITVVIACRPLLTLRVAPRLFSWAAGFSYSLYATHVPVVFLTISVLQSVGFPDHRVLPSTLAFLGFVICTTVPVIFAYSFSLFTERETERFRLWLKTGITAVQSPVLRRPIISQESASIMKRDAVL